MKFVYYKMVKDNKEPFVQNWLELYPFRWEIRLSLTIYSYGIIIYKNDIY